MPGFFILSRRDRSENVNRGGVLTFCRKDIKNIVFWKNSADAERSWHLIHRDSGTIGLCNWYRPPHSENISINSLREELEELTQFTESFVIAGNIISIIRSS